MRVAERLTCGTWRQLTYIRAPHRQIVSALGLVRGNSGELTACRTALLEKLTVIQLVKTFFVLRKTRHFTASSKYLVKRNCPRWTHATLWWKILWSYTLILTSILDYSPIWPFFSYSHTKILSKLLIPFQTCYMTRSPHFPYLTNIIMCEKGYELGRLSLCIFLWLPFTWISYLAN